MIRYTIDDTLIEVKETENTGDYTFHIQVKTEEMRARIKRVRSFFEDNKDYTDAMFYSHHNGVYEVIVRRDKYITFLLIAFKYRCIESISWDK